VILVSACLAGCSCRYDAASSPHPLVIDMVRAGMAMPVCPEQLGGLGTPRAPCEIHGGHGGDVLAGQARVLTKDGYDLTKALVRGARECLQLARLARVSQAVLKSCSPSCAVLRIYDGTFSGILRPGPGVTAALLQQHGVQVIEETQPEAVLQLLSSH